MKYLLALLLMHSLPSLAQTSRDYPTQENERPKKQAGSYMENKKDQTEEGPEGKQAQQAAKDGSLDLSEEEIKRKQKGN